MIPSSDCDLVGKVNKTHGLEGELSVSFFSEDLIEEIEPGDCLIFDIDGINTPFFVRTVRPRGGDALLLSFDGVEDQVQAQPFVGKSVFAIIDKDDTDGNDDSEGAYAGQLIGYDAIDADSGQKIGVISDIDDSTANVLFIIDAADGRSQIRIPAVGEFITEISFKTKSVYFSLPTGLLDL